MNTSNNRSVRVLLGTIVFLLSANLLVQMNAGSNRTVFAAGIPDSGAQAQATIDQLMELNKKMDKLQGFLESGNLGVKVKDTKSEK
jgi:hypothetical protein